MKYANYERIVKAGWDPTPKIGDLAIQTVGNHAFTVTDWDITLDIHFWETIRLLARGGVALEPPGRAELT